MASEVSKASLSADRMQLLEQMQRLNFGRIEGLEVCNGEPRLDPPPRIVREVKFLGENGSRRELDLEDFTLKKEVLEFFNELGRLRNGVIERVEVKHGLPFRMTINESPVTKSH